MSCRSVLRLTPGREALTRSPSTASVIASLLLLTSDPLLRPPSCLLCGSCANDALLRRLANQKKEEGNQLFSKGLYLEAANLYTEAIGESRRVQCILDAVCEEQVTGTSEAGQRTCSDESGGAPAAAGFAHSRCSCCRVTDLRG